MKRNHDLACNPKKIEQNCFAPQNVLAWYGYGQTYWFQTQPSKLNFLAALTSEARDFHLVDSCFKESKTTLKTKDLSILKN